MRSRTVHLALLAGVVMVASMALPRAAEAGGWGFSAHGGFRVGGFGFSIGYHHRHHDPYYRRVPFYRVDRPISYRGYGCGSACYLSEGSYYHHNACPLVLHHFRRHNYVQRWQPGAYYYNHRDRYRGDRRYDYRRDPRHDYRYRGDRRYDSRRDPRYDYRRDPRYDHRRRHDGDSDSDSGYRPGRNDRRGAYRTRPRP